MTLSTGIDPIDRKLDGGIHPGSIVAVVTPPEAQVEPLLCASIGHRPTRYFTTVKTEDDLRRQVGRVADDPQLERLENERVFKIDLGEDVRIDRSRDI